MKRKVGIEKDILRNFSDLRGTIKHNLGFLGKDINEKLRMNILNTIDIIANEIENSIKNKIEDIKREDYISNLIEKDKKFKVIYKTLIYIDGVSKNKLLDFYNHLKKEYGDDLHGFVFSKSNIIYKYKEFLSKNK